MFNARQITILNRHEEPKQRVLIKYSVVGTLVAMSLAFSALLAFAQTIMLAFTGVLAFARTMSNAFTVY